MIEEATIKEQQRQAAEQQPPPFPAPAPPSEPEKGPVYEEVDMQDNGYSIPNFVKWPQRDRNNGYEELRRPRRVDFGNDYITAGPEPAYSRRLPSLDQSRI